MLSPGEVIEGRYEVEALLGQGGMAQVFRVRHLKLGSVHALKMLGLRRPGLTQRLLLEGRIQAQLRHPNVVAVTDVVEHNGQPGLMMEYVEHLPLDELIRGGQGLSLDDALSLFAQILAGTSAAHRAGVLHRDIKPANILLARTPRGLVPKVSDFGLAKLTLGESSGTLSGIPMGTPGYLAPEQATDAANVDARADIFSLGCVLFELLAGRPAFQEIDGTIAVTTTIERPPLPLERLRAGLPPHLVAAIYRSLEPDPARRFADCDAFAAALFPDRPALSELVRGHGQPTPIATAPFRPPAPAAARPSAAPAASATQPAPAQERTTGGRFPALRQTFRPATAHSGGRGVGALEAALLGLAVTMGVGASAWMLWPSPSAPTVAEQEGDDDLTRALANLAAGAAADAPDRGAASPPAAGAAMSAAEDEAQGAPAAAPDRGGGPTDDPGEREAEGAASEGAASEGAASEGAASGASSSGASSSGASSSGASSSRDGASDAGSGSDAASTRAAGSQAAGGGSAPPEASPQAPPSLLGSWSGKANDRPLTLRITSQEGDLLGGELIFISGANQRTEGVSGRVDASGQLSLSGGSLTLTGRVEGSMISGSFTQSGRGRAQSWWVSR
jgi:hypothetical protein